MSGYGISFMKMKKKKLEERQALSWVDVEGRWVIIVSESRNPFLVEHVSWYWLNEHAKEILLQGRESLVARLVAEERERERKEEKCPMKYSREWLRPQIAGQSAFIELCHSAVVCESV